MKRLLVAPLPSSVTLAFALLGLNNSNVGTAIWVNKKENKNILVLLTLNFFEKNLFNICFF